MLLVYFYTAVRVHWLYGEIASKPFPSSHPCFYSQEPNHRKADFRECAIERHTKVTTDNDCYCCIAEKNNLFLLGYNEYKYTTKWVYNRLFLSQEIYRFPFFVNYTANAMDIFFMQDNNHSDFMTVYLLLSLVNYDIVIELWRII